MNLEEVREVYARSLARHERSMPPPGYTGTAFVGSGREQRDGGEPMAGKRHTPEEYASGPKIPGPQSPVPPAPSETERPAQPPEPRGNGNPLLPDALSGLIGELRGRIGREEMVLLLVILLLAADGAGIETLLLGLLLLSGRE